jgi:hypothetical protein
MNAAARAATLAALTWLVSGCARAPYPAPEPEPGVALRPRGREPIDSGDAARLAALEQACRARSSDAAVAAALRSLDRLRDALGPGCELDSVDGEPLRLAGQCPADVLFQPGGHALASLESACKVRGSARGSAAECAGAVLAAELGASEQAALSRVELLVAGGVASTDALPVSYVECANTLQALGHGIAPSWPPPDPNAVGEARSAALARLALCRAAEFAGALQRGLHTGGAPGLDTASRLELALLGAELDVAPRSPQDPAPALGPARLQIVVQLVPNLDAPLAACELAGAEAALYCLERCTRQSALARGPTTANVAALPSLFGSATLDAASLLARGIELHELTTSAERHLDLSQACRSLGSAMPPCAGTSVQNLGVAATRDTKKP